MALYKDSMGSVLDKPKRQPAKTPTPAPAVETEIPPAKFTGGPKAKPGSTTYKYRDPVKRRAQVAANMRKYRARKKAEKSLDVS